MRKVKQTIIVPYSAKEMYELVNDIASYPKFVPWCKTTKIISHTNKEITATIYIAKGFFSYHFTTKNTLTENELIDMKLFDGPFNHLAGFWLFENLSSEGLSTNKCKITFELEFTFSSNLLSMTLDPIFHSILVKFVGAFKDRAEEVYGKRDV